MWGIFNSLFPKQPTKISLHALTGNSEQFYEHRETISALVRAGKIDINGLNDAKQTPLQCILNQRRWFTDDAMFLVRLGADPNVTDLNGQPFIHRLVTRNQNIEVTTYNEIKSLINDFKVSINSKNRDGKTPLQYLLDRNKPFFPRDILLLVELGADPNTKNSSGDTILHILAKSIYDHSSEIKQLIACGKADPLIKDAQGLTPFEAGLNALEKGQHKQASNLQALMAFNAPDFSSRMSAFQEKSVQLDEINNLFTKAHQTLGQNYELQGKIRETAFSALKKSLENLSNHEKLEKLQWARSQPIFCLHRATSFFATIGNTNTVNKIDNMMKELLSNFDDICHEKVMFANSTKIVFR